MKLRCLIIDDEPLAQRVLEKYIAELAQMEFDDSVKDQLDILDSVRKKLIEAVPFVKDSGIDYMDLYGKDIVDVAVFVIIGYLFCSQASSKVDMDTAVANNGEEGTAKSGHRARCGRTVVEASGSQC